MSRRSRRRRASGSGGSSKWLIAVVAFFLLLVIAIGVVHTMIRRYLQSDEFRIFLSNKVSEAIQVEGEFKPLQWDGLAVRSKGFEAEGNEQIRMLKIEGLRTEIGLGGFWDGVWQVQGFQIRQVDLEIDARSGVTPAIRKVDRPREKSGWLPSEVEMQSMKIGRMSVNALLDSGSLEMSGVRVDAVPGSARQSYEVRMTGGELSLPDKRIPEIRLDKAELRYRDGAVFITHAEGGFWERGRVEMSGEWDPALDIRGAQGSVSGVNCEDLINEDWSKRIRGKLATDFDVAWVAGEPMANGHLVMQDGMLTALPILEVLEAYLDTTRFRMLTLNEAHTDWRWREGQWSIHNLVVASEGLMRLEGGMRVTGDKIDGNFRLGIAPGTLASIPGAEEHVFLPGEKGLRWAPIRVTGTLSKPEHDLTERLIAAAGRRLIEALPEATLESLLLGKNVVDASTQKAVQEGIKLLEGGPELIEKIENIGQGVISEGLEGLLKGGSEEGPNPGLDGGLLRGLLNGL